MNSISFSSAPSMRDRSAIILLDIWGDHGVHCTSGAARGGNRWSDDAVLNSARQRATQKPAFPTPVPGHERLRFGPRLYAGIDRATLTSMFSAHVPHHAYAWDRHTCC